MVATGSDDYRLARIMAFINPELSPADDAYQQLQSMMAIGSGGVHGIGMFVDGALSQLNYVPADWTDFIYSTIGEAWGFLGCGLVLILYLLIILRMLYLARFTYDKFGMLIIIGVLGMLLFHVFENIGMTLGLMPITGIPLPFLSYGGSNMTTNMGGIALVLNVTKNRSLSAAISAPQTNSTSARYIRRR
jgi:rod shape determining protein RodA